MKISLVLLVKNGAKYLDRLFEALERQTVIINEIMIVDSGSTDGSLEIIRRSHLMIGTNEGATLKMLEIKPEEFGHGKTRNLAVRKASGEIVVFLTQDAVPQDERWLENLTKPLLIQRHSGERSDSRIKNGFWTSLSTPSSRPRGQNDEKNSQNDGGGIAGVFGKQIPWPNTDLCEKYFYSQSYPDTPRIMTKKDSESFSNKNIFFSNVSGAVRRDLLLKFPFREDLIMSEDQFWGREVLRAGYKIVYEPTSVVWHSHNYNLIQLFKRYVQSGYSQRQLNLKGDVFVKGAGTALGLLGYLGKNKPWLLPFGIVYELVKGTAFILGKSGVCL